MRMNRLVLCLFVIILIPIASATTGKLIKSRHNVTEVQQMLKLLNKTPVKSIQSPNGDIVDCILINEQPGFDHPLSKNHTFQTRPSSEPKGQNEESYSIHRILQTVNVTCPHGTVPIKRIKEEELLRTKSLKDFGKKFGHEDYYDPSQVHEHAIGVMDTEGPYYGMRGIISIWSPEVFRGEFSLAQTWIFAGSRDDGSLNTIEAGWQIYPEKYGDNLPRLFTFWTSSAYGAVGCYNTDCPGFFQVSDHLVPGHTSLDHVSEYGGVQYDVAIKIWKEDKDEKWWLKIADEIVGYWPSYLFQALADKGEEVDFGGEVVNTAGNKEHTITKMGSGHFADEGYTKAAYISNIQFVDSSKNLVNPMYLEPYAFVPKCYNVQCLGDTGNRMGHHIYFGGPGRNKYCP